MRRRDFLVGLLFAAAVPSVPAQEQAKQHRIAIIATGPVSRIHDPQVTAFHAFFEELRRWAMSKEKTSPSIHIPAEGALGATPNSQTRS